MTGLVVAGFHRSGTSSVAQVLDSYGIPLGDDLMPGNEYNKFGYFESWPVVNFHDRVLQRNGSEWYRLLEQPIELTADEETWIRDYAAKRDSEARDGEAPDWALKDPRMCRFVRQWKALVPGLKFIVVYRTPAETCQSINRRASLMLAKSEGRDVTSQPFYEDPDLALRLWVEHHRDLLDLVRAHPQDCVVLGHHHILAGYPLMDILRSRFGIEPAKQPERSTVDAEALSDKIRVLHYRDPALVQDAVAIWHALQAADVAVAEGRPAIGIEASFEKDPTGRLARAYLSELQVPILYGQIAALHERVGSLHQEMGSIHHGLARDTELLRDTVPLMRRLDRGPFRWYLRGKRKYRDILDRWLTR